MTARHAIVFYALAALTAACTGTETGNPPLTTRTGFGGYEPMGIANDPEVSSMWWVVRDVAFVPAGECDAPGDPQIGFEGPAATSLTGEGGDPIDVEVTEGSQCALRFALAAGTDPLPSGAPPELAAASLVIEAQLRDGTPVRVIATGTPQIALDGATGFEVSEDLAPVIVGVDFTLLFAGTLLESATLTDGAVLLDDTHETERLATLLANLPGAVFLYRDTDADGLLDPEETRSPPLAAP